MRQEIGRRAFVGCIAAGVPLLGDAAFARERVQRAAAVAHVHTADPVSDEVMRQLQTAVKALRETGKAEHARAIASALRLAAAHASATALDDVWKRGLNQQIRAGGLSSIVGREIDARRWQAEAAAFGAPDLQVPSVSFEDREKGVNAILTTGITGSLLSAAAEFDRSARGLARRAERNGFTRVQYMDCSAVNNMVSIVEWEIAIACGFPIDGGSACAFLTGTYIGLQATAWWYGCW
jgi:hypothetical protein